MRIETFGLRSYILLTLSGRPPLQLILCPQFFLANFLISDVRTRPPCSVGEHNPASCITVLRRRTFT